MTTRRSTSALVGMGGCVAAAPALYLAALSTAALTYPVQDRDPDSPVHLTVVVPAHDEELLLGRCLDSLLAQDYPDGFLKIVVVADNCSDATSQVAHSRGVRALERFDQVHVGKGYALAWAFEQLLAEDPAMEGVVVVDADSVTHPRMVANLAAALAGRGAQAVQADYEAIVDGTDDVAHLRQAAYLLFHRARFSGKARLGLPVSLVGNGMLLSRALLEAHPWDAHSEVEDLEYALELRVAGIGPAYAGGALIWAPVASGGEAALVQRSRWEGGRLRLARQQLPRLADKAVREQRPDLWDAVVDLALPPLGLLASGLAAGTVGAVALRLSGRASNAAVAPWLVASGALGVHVLVGLKAANADPEVMRSLRSAPRLVLSETRARARVLAGRSSSEWVRTPREGFSDPSPLR